jgi:hypothetical protein
MNDPTIIGSESAKTYVGQFYEELAKKLLHVESFDESLYPSVGYTPDFISRSENSLYEIKASSNYNFYHLLDRQINDFKKINDREIYFAFFTHGLKKINGEFNKKSDLFSALAEKTESLLVLPFNVVEKVHHEGICRYEGNYANYTPLTRFRRKEINYFLNNPEEKISRFTRKDNYKLKKVSSPCISVDGNNVNPFYMVRFYK